MEDSSNFFSLRFYELIRKVVSEGKANTRWGGAFRRDRLLISMDIICKALPEVREEFNTSKFKEIFDALEKDDQTNLLELAIQAYDLDSSTQNNAVQAYSGMELVAYLAADFPFMVNAAATNIVSDIIKFKFSPSAARQDKVLSYVWKFCKEEKENLIDAYIMAYANSGIDDKYMIKDQLEYIGIDWIERLLEKQPEQKIFKCGKCGFDLTNSLDTLIGNCPKCKYPVSGRVTCLICDYDGEKTEFRANICPSCGSIDGIPRNLEQAKKMTISMCIRFKRVGTLRVQLKSETVLIKVRKDLGGNFHAELVS